MDNALTQFLTYQFLLFSLLVAGLTWMVKKVTDYLVSKGKVSLHNVWNDLLLPMLPTILGGLLGLLFKKYPFPEEIISASGRFAFGLVAGMFSGLIYRVVKAAISVFLKSKTDLLTPAKSDGYQEQDKTDTTTI